MSKEKENGRENPPKENPPKKQEPEPTQQLATAQVFMHGNFRSYEPGDTLMIEQDAYIPGNFTLADKAVQAKWDKAFQKALRESE